MSKKHKQRPLHAGVAAAETGQRHAGGEAGKGFEIPDEILHAPKETSKLRFALMILLVIVLLLIFAIPSGLSGLGRWGRSQAPAAFTWVRPGHGEIDVSGADLQVAYREFTQAFQVDLLAQGGLGITEKFDAQGTARLLVLDQLAEDAGLVITDGDLKAHLNAFLELGRMTVDDYRRRVQMVGSNEASIERTVRRILRIARYLQITGYAAAVPDPAEIEEMWKREHIEFAFEYVSLPPADMKEVARLVLPDEAGLKAWFDGLDEATKKELETPEKRKAEFAAFKSIEETPAAALVAAFPPEPPAEGGEPPSADQLAQDYYNRVFHRRFVKEVDDVAADGHEHHDHDQPARTEFQTFEEVKDRCLAEAPVYFALQRWLQDLQGRKAAGETIDFAAEAAQYGLAHRALEAPLTRDELGADAELDDAQVASAVFEAAPDGGFHFVPVATKSALLIPRVVERVEPVLPPFEEIYDEVVEKWLEPQTEQLALDRLKGVWMSFEAFEPAPKEEPMSVPSDDKVHRRATPEAFATGAATATLVLERRDFIDRAAPANEDPLFETPSHRYLASRFDLYQLEEGEVAEPELARDKSAAYLVRVAGRREVPLERMSPAQYDRYKKNARMIAAAEMATELDIAFLEKNFGFAMARAEDEETGADDGSRPAEEDATPPAEPTNGAPDPAGK